MSLLLFNPSLHAGHHIPMLKSDALLFEPVPIPARLKLRGDQIVPDHFDMVIVLHETVTGTNKREPVPDLEVVNNFKFDPLTVTLIRDLLQDLTFLKITDPLLVR